MKAFLTLLFNLIASAALAQNPTCPTRPPGDTTNACSSTAFTQNAASNPMTPLLISPAASTLGVGVIVTQSVGGTTATQLNLNQINITSDTAAVTGGNFANALAVQMTIGGSTMQGGRQAILGQTNLVAPTSASNTNRNYVGMTGVGEATTGDGGTNTGAGALGAVFGMNPVGQAFNGATNLLGVKGGEVNISLATGSSARLKAGWTVVPLASDAVHGVALDAGFSIGAQTGAVGLNQGYWITNTNGQFPLAAGATVLGSDSAGTVTHGVDLSLLTCSTDCYKSTGFSIDGSGNLTANNVTTAWTAFTPSYACGTATFTNNSSRSKTVGKTTFLQIEFTITAIGTCTNALSFSMPNTAQSSGTIPTVEIASNGTIGICRFNPGGATANCSKGTLSNFLVNDHFVGSGVYENQ